MLWLEADTLIRKLSHGRRTLDDFCAAFHGAPGGLPQVKTYDFDALIAALNAVQPYDWRSFCRPCFFSFSSACINSS